MKKFSLCILFCLLPVFCFAQLRSRVCIVRPNYSEKVIQNMRDFVPRLEKLGVEDPEEQIEEFIEKGSSGSGFVYVASDGKNYIITNRHVIADANTSSISFQDENGDETRVYTGLKILAASADLDLAILAFPNDERPFEKGFTFSDTKLKDGDSVYTAGYPGLLGNPAWQFGAGIITNANSKVPEMINPEYSNVIQHSAQVDAGNSGGPLLIKNANDEYEVVGVNTWKISNRQSANFSIPASTASKFINDVLSGNKVALKSPEDAIMEQAVELQKVLNKFNVTFEEITNFISIDFIEQEGKQIFDYTYNRCSVDNRNTLKEILVHYSPIMCMRYAIAWYVFNEFHKDEYTDDVFQKQSVKELPEIPEPIKYEDSDIWYTSFYLAYTHTYAKNEWCYTNGGWGLSAFKKMGRSQLENPIPRMGEKGSKQDKTGNPVREIPEDQLFYTPNIVSASIGMGLYASRPSDKVFVADIEIKLLNILAIDVTALANKNNKYLFYQGEKYSFFNFADALLGVQFQFPIATQKIIFMPYLTAQGGAQFSNWNELAIDPVARAEGGVRVNFFLGESNMTIFVDTNCQMLLDFKEFKPRFDVVLDVGMSF